MPVGVVLGVAAGLVAALAACWRWERALERRTGRGLGFDAAPFAGDWRSAATPRFLVPVGLAAVAVVFGPQLAARVRWAGLLAASAAWWVVWVLALGLIDGAASVTGYLGSSFDYLAGVHRVTSVGGFLRHFTERIGNYPTHVRGHPPGMVVLLALLQRAGLGGTGPVLVLCLVGGASAVVSVLVAVRALAGEQWARRCAPFLVLAPTTVVATNVDLLYAGVGAAAIAFATLAVTVTDTVTVGRRPLGLAVASGALLGLAGLGSYGLVPVVLPVAAVALWRRRPALLVPVAVTMGAVLAAPAIWGFWWPDGLAATSHQYWSGIAHHRPGNYFAVANSVVAAAMLGPVALVSVVLLWRRRAGRALQPLVIGVLAILGVALGTQFSKGEVERIWQPFYPWLLATCGVMGLPARRQGHFGDGDGDGGVASRTALALHVSATLALAFCLRSPW